MLLNLSNHPSHLWDEKQKSAAAAMFGQIIDLSFPDISPDADEWEIENLADRFFHQCTEIISKTHDVSNAVHLMGEMTFTFCLVAKLQKAGIRCVASTSNRMVLSAGDGSKTVKFEFCRFRIYPQLNKA